MTLHPEEVPTEALLDGRYRLGECIGEGGMARVYRAEDLTLERTVAIKMLRAGADAAATPERAHREMTVLAGLNHPSLVTLYDATVASGRADYLVMEFVDGPSLAARLHEGPLPSGDLARILAELADALHAVHSSGVVHRDIKPSNVLLAPAGVPGRPPRAKLADFGVAYLVDSTRHTTPGLVVGTGAYLAPEQVRGEAITPAADIYALGLMTLEALTGQRAFPHATGIGAVLARLTTAPEIPAWLGPEWTDLIVRMISPDAGARPVAAEVAMRALTLPELIRPVAGDAGSRALAALPATQPFAAVLAPPPAGPAAMSPPATRRGAHVAARRMRRVRPWLVAASAAVVIVALVHVGLQAIGSAGGALLPDRTVPVATEPTLPAEDGVLEVEEVEEVADDTDTGGTIEPVATDPLVTVPVTPAAPEQAGKSPEAPGQLVSEHKQLAADQKKQQQEQEKLLREQEKAAKEAEKAAEKAEETAARDAGPGERPPVP